MKTTILSNNNLKHSIMAYNSSNSNISLSDVSFMLESFEILTFITAPTLQSYQFVAALNRMLDIDMCNNGVIELTRKKQTFSTVIYSAIDNQELFYVLLDIRNNNLDRALKSYDKMLLISGDYNKPKPAKMLVDEFQNYLPDTIDCRHLDFSENSSIPDKTLDSLVKLFNGDKNNDGLLYQIEMHLKEQMYLEEMSDDDNNDLLI